MPPRTPPSTPTDVDASDDASDDAVAAFWRWFASVADALGAASPPPPLLEELTARLQDDLGIPGWEIGPALRTGARRLLALSPEGDPELLPRTGAVIDAAPRLDGWELYAARPPRPEAPLRFSMGDVDVDANAWRFVCLVAPEPGADETGIVVEQPGLERLLADPDDRLAAAIICVDGLIGEGRRLEIFSEVYAAPSLHPHEAALARPIGELPAALDEDVD
jgi:hypothetical protein